MTDKVDVATILKNLGISDSDAQSLVGKLDGNDFMNLVDAANCPQGSFKGRQEANNILGKYGITVENTQMDSSYLDAKYESMKAGKTLDETFGVMSRVNEGFTYAVEVTEQTRDNVLDWLDENKVTYQATTPLSYQIECSDRESAYRTGRALANILRKPTVRDSIEVEEAVKDHIKRAKAAEKKLAAMKTRNPIAALPVAGRAGPMDKKPERDSIRGVKHKKAFDEAIGYFIGESVMVGLDHGTVKIPHGPNHTIGVIVNGSLEMVAESEVSRLDEGVISMSKMNPLFRLRELAGLPKNMDEDDFSGIEVADAPEIDPQGILAPGPVGSEAPIDAELDMDPSIDTGLDTSVDDEMGELPSEVDMGSDLDPSIDADAGIPGAIGSEPISIGMGTVPTQSEAMSQIEDALNSIQTSLADIRLSEYKSLVQKLQDLTNQAQMMGRDYLGERRKK